MSDIRVASRGSLRSSRRLSIAVVAVEPALAGAVGRLLDWIELSRQRRHLLELSDALLKDIGLTRADVEGEAAKPFWRA